MSLFDVMNATSENFVHKRILGAVGGFISGGPLGAVRGFVTTGGGSRKGLPRTAAIMQRGGGAGPVQRTIPVRPIPSIRGLAQRIVPGGATGLQVTVPAAGSGCPSGFHPNKSDYMTKAGFVAQGSKCVRNRRRNLSNGRANTRALRRMAAWDKQERRLGKTMKAIARGR